MSKKIQAIRGMNDILPGQTCIWQGLENVFREVVCEYGYRELRIPLLEFTQLFARSIGEVTDIVEKEMYTFPDRNGESLTLRPEGTAGCVRACIENGLLHNQVQRIWYSGPMFRYERPQRGRYRQFYQFGAEAYGMEGPDIDAELIILTARLWKRLGLEDVSLELNSLGSSDARTAYRDRLVQYFRGRREELDEDSLRRLETNPLRILDTKNPAMAVVVAGAPLLLDHLDDPSRRHFDQLGELLTAAGVAFDLNVRLVRGLDYYSRTVFEWTTDQLGAQGTICGGGRYDALVQLVGGRPTPAVGFAMGVERLVALLDAQGFVGVEERPQVFLAVSGDRAVTTGFRLGEQLRDRIPGLRLLHHCGTGGFKSQLKRADRSGALFAFIIGDDEVEASSVTIKPLRGGEQQQTISQNAAADFLAERL